MIGFGEERVISGLEKEIIQSLMEAIVHSKRHKGNIEPTPSGLLLSSVWYFLF